MKFVLGLVLAFSSFCFADEPLRLGSPAPELRIERWMRGDPVMGFKAGQVYLVEFWATWCGPCIEAMPKLMKYQNQYADQGLHVIGVANREIETDRGEAENKVETFLKANFPEINYAIGFEQSGWMMKAWLEPGLNIAIPRAFVIDREGKIAYIGHPSGLKDILPKIIAGTWSQSDEAKSWDEERLSRDVPAFAHDQLVRPFYRAVRAAFESQNWSKGLAASEAGLAIDPQDPTFLSRRAEILLYRQPDLFRAKLVMKEFIELAKKSENHQLTATAFNLLFGVQYDLSKVSQALRLSLGDELAENMLKWAEQSPWKYLFYPDLAQYFWEKGDHARGVQLSQAAVDALLSENEEYRHRVIKAYGHNVAQRHANLTQESVCIGDVCVLPQKCEDLVR